MSPRREDPKLSIGRGPGAGATAELPPEIAAELASLEAALLGEPGASDELSMLVRDVRAAAPELDAGAARELDVRVREHFVRPAPRSRAQRAEARGGERLARRQLARAPRGILGALADAWRNAPMALATVCVLVVMIGAGGVAALQSGGGFQQFSDDAGVLEFEEHSATGGAGGSGDQARPADGSSAEMAGGAEMPAASEAGESEVQSSSRETSASPASPASGASSAGSGSGASSQSAPGAGGREQRAVRRSASMTVQVDELAEAAREVGRITADAGGYVDESQVSVGSASEQRGQFSLRLPTAEVDEALRAFGELGVVLDEQRSASDITSQLDSAERRLDDAEQERRALLRSLSAATGAGEIAALRARIDDNRRERSRLDAEVRRVQRLTTTTPIELQLTTSDWGVPAPERDGIAGALDDAWGVLEGIAVAAILILAVLGPFLALAAGGWWLTRRRRRARRARALGD